MKLKNKRKIGYIFLLSLIVIVIIGLNQKVFADDEITNVSSETEFIRSNCKWWKYKINGKHYSFISACIFL